MRIDVDLNKIIENIDVKKIVEEKIMSDILDNSKLEDIVDQSLENEDLKASIDKKVLQIITDYLSSGEGKEYIIDKFKDAITDSDILNDDKIIEIFAEFLKKSLAERLR